MIRSMTGFAALTRETDDATVTVTVRSVNHRHLDLQMRLPATLAGIEPVLRAIVPRRVERGRVEIATTLVWRRAPIVEVELHEGVASAVAVAIEQARTRGLVSGSMTPGDLLRLPQAVTIRERPPEEDASLLDRVRNIVETAVDEGLGALDQMRVREGAFLRADLEERRRAVESLVERIAAAAERGREAAEARLARRLRELSAELQGDPAAVAQEIVRFVARSDISEELVRLRGHLGHWIALVDGPDPCGRKLEFLLQEMNREVNTIGAKAEGVDVPALVVSMKAELERMREQAQNVE